MKTQSSLVVIVVLFGTLFCGVLGQMWGSRAPVDPSHPNQCYDERMARFYAVGETWVRPDKCEGITCKVSETVGFMTITGESCPYASPSSRNCHIIPAQTGIAFPECCPKVKCDEEPIGQSDAGRNNPS